MEVHIKRGVTPAPYSGTSFALTKTKQQWYKYDVYGLIVLLILNSPAAGIKILMQSGRLLLHIQKLSFDISVVSFLH